jgi:hypothetical protein
MHVAPSLNGYAILLHGLVGGSAGVVVPSGIHYTSMHTR